MSSSNVSAQRQQILAELPAAIRLPAVTSRYLQGLLLTVLGLLFLPLLYAAVVLLLAIGLAVLWLQANLLFPDWPIAVRCSVVSIVSLLLSSLLLGLLKPFLAGATVEFHPHLLRRSEEPFLYMAIDKLCAALGAAPPDVICVTRELNAAVEVRYRWLGIGGRESTRLHLGLPLIAGLSLRQFIGILGHELGHLAQQKAMTSERATQRITDWFQDAAYGTDSIDIWLTRHATGQSPLVVFSGLARCAIWCSRGILKLLAQAGRIISCQMSREMEFHADVCEVSTVGWRTLASTLWRLRQLSVAYQLSFLDATAFHAEGRLPDDLIALSIANTNFITPKVRRRLRKMMINQRTGRFDTHPSDADRIRTAIRDEHPAIPTMATAINAAPATILFDQFERWCRLVTVDFYESAFGRKIKPQSLHDVGRLLERQQVEVDAAKALRRYFQTTVPVLRPLPVAEESSQVPENPREIIAELTASRARMLSELPNYERLSRCYQAAEECFYATVAAQSLVELGLNFHPPDYHLASASREAVTSKLARSKEGLQNLAGKLLLFESEAGNRMSFALQLLGLPEVQQQIEKGDELYDQVSELLPEARFVSELISELPSLRIVFCRLQSVCERPADQRNEPRQLQYLTKRSQSLHFRLTSLQREMGDRLYPFDHAQATTTLQKYTLPYVPPQNDLPALVNAADQLQSRLVSIQNRLFAKLAQAAEKVEAAIGMPPLSEPTTDQEES